MEYEMLLNISADQVILTNWSDTEYFEISDLEYTLSERLVELYKERSFENIFLINWPWWFTNLRIGTLCLNTLNSLCGNKIWIFDISKIELFESLIKNNLLPKKGIIYIGQKHNVREYSFEEKEYETIKKSEIKFEDDIFLDFVMNKEYFEDNEKMVKLNYEWNWILECEFWKKTQKLDLEKLWLKKEIFVKWNYFIQPIMWTKWQ